MVSWKLGGVFKPTTESSVYASYAKSLTPPGTGFVLSSASNSVNAVTNNPSTKPQETHHYEIGTKWVLNDDKIILTAAAYHTENENQITQDPISLTYILKHGHLLIAYVGHQIGLQHYGQHIALLVLKQGLVHVMLMNRNA